MSTRSKRAITCVTAVALLAAQSVAFAAGAPVGSATDQQRKEATSHFKAGMKAEKGGNHDTALTEFQASYDAVASPNSHLLVARALAELGRFAEAYVAYDQTEQEARAIEASDEKYKNAADAAASERDALRAKIALIQIDAGDAGPDDEIEVGGKAIDHADWGKPIPVMPGKISVVLKRKSGGTTEKEVDAAAGEAPTVSLSTVAAPVAAPEAAPAEAHLSTSGMHSSKRTLAYVAGGVGIAGIATFAIFGAMSNSKFNDLSDSCPNGSCPPAKKDQADTGRTYQTVANVGLAVGIVGIGSSVVLFLMSKSDKKEQSPAAGTPQVYIGSRSVTVRGSF